MPLPGLEAQIKMAPSGREKLLNQTGKLKLKNAKQAAVICLFYPKHSEPHFVLMKRVEYQGVHSGQISFPGGRLEEGESPDSAVIRETFEETGIQLQKDNTLTPLTSIYIPPSNFYVFPFIGYLNNTPVFKPDKKEVAYLIDVPVAEFINPSAIKKKLLKYSYGTFEAPYFDLQGETVWGATAMILGEVLELLQT